MRFSQPFLLWLLVLALLPFVSAVFFNGYYRIYLSEMFQKRRSRKWEWIRTAVASLVIAGLALILAGPIRTESFRNPLKNGIDILFVLDLSKSMLAEDIAPNRINAGKRVLSAFIGDRASDRIGLIGFAGKPFVFSPLTFDHAGLLKIVSDMTVDSIRQEIPGFSGTAIGDALLLASDTVTTEPERKKVIILLTDGEANVGIDPNIANEYMKNTGVVIHTIGIGNPEGTDLFTTDSFWKKQYFMDNRGVPIRASLDEPLLRKLAGDNGGIYANASSLKQMEKALEDLNRLYGKTLEAPPETIVIPYAPYVAYFVLFLVFAWLILEMFSITGAFHLDRFTGIALTEESKNYAQIRSLLWGKRIFLALGFASLTLGATQYRYHPPVGTVSLLIDGSKSMLAEDVGKSRFDLAKEVAGEIIEGYSGNPIRISVFWGDVFPVVPSTYDSQILKRSLEAISLKSISGGSDILGSIRTFLAQIGEGRNTVFIISDGEVVGSRIGDSSSYVDIPENVSLWTVGVGTTKGGYVPIGKDLFGNPTVKTVNGVPVISKFSEELLKRLARNGGRYFHVENANSIKSAIGNRSTPNGAGTEANLPIPLGAAFLLLAMALPYRKRITR